jgi:hypothetical protein
MTRLYSNASSYPKLNAQRNLQGRTHYVDDDTLRGFHSRILSARATHEGMLFAITTSDAGDYQNRTRVHRYVIFDVFGTVLERPTIEDSFRTSKQALAAMWKAINAIDAKAVTLAAIENAKRNHAHDMEYLAADIAKLAV